MVGELLCPDCGGIVGATETTEAGYPCRCFAADPSSSKMDGTVGGDRATGDIGTVEAPVAEPPKPKICRTCGKDVAGQRRVKDSAGYMCYDCAKAEEKRELGDRVKCKVCGHLVKESSISAYEGTLMCSKCLTERKDLQKQQIKKIGIASARYRAEFSQIQKLMFFGGVLLVIILLSTWYVTHGHHH